MKIFRYLGRALRATTIAVGSIAIGGAIFALADNYALTQGSGTTFASKVISAVNYAQMIICDATTGTSACATVSSGALKVDNSAVTQPVSGTVTANQGGNWSTRTQDGSGNAITSTSSHLDVNVANANSNGAATAANSAPVVNAVDQVNSTTGNIVANNTTAVVVNAAATTLYGAQIFGIGSAPAYLKLYNATSATCGSGTPVKRLMIPAAATAANGAGAVIPFPGGLRFSTGLTYCVTTGIADNDSTAPAASTFLVNLDWR